MSNLNARLAQRFLALVLLPRVRREIREHHKLHFALFQALKKSTYKPGAFFKVGHFSCGMCEGGTENSKTDQCSHVKLKTFLATLSGKHVHVGVG